MNIAELESLTQRLVDRDEKTKKEVAVFQAIQENALDGWWKWDLNDNSVEFCERWASILGYESAPKDVETIRNVILPEDLEIFDSAVNAHLYTDKPLRFIVRFKKGNGDVIHVLIKGKALKDNNDHPFMLVGIQIDITDILP